MNYLVHNTLLHNKKSFSPLQVLAGVLCLTAASYSGACAQDAPVAPDSSEARVSLRLQKMPLPQMLTLLGVQTGVGFRYAAIPDAEATLVLEDAPLRSALRDVLATLGFETRTGQSTNSVQSAPEVIAVSNANAPLWLWREVGESERNAPAMKAVETWQMWSRATPPHARWMKPPAQRNGEFSGTVNVGASGNSGVPGVAPVGVHVRWRDSTNLAEEASWKIAPTVFNARTLPGVELDWSGQPANANVPRLRWPMWLRSVPGRVQLSIETDRPANLWVNGARVLRAWTGTRRIELGDSLQPGLNLLALEWEPRAPKEKTTQSATSPAANDESKLPLLRYEWLVGS